MILTVLSRLGYLSLAGASIVISQSMEPSIRRFDLVLYASINYTKGDVIVYCPTPSHCYVHRVVEFIVLDTVNGNETMVVTKGDNVNETDSPVKTAWVRGRVFLVVPRELWVPLALLFAVHSIIGMIRLPVVGLSHALVFIVGLTTVIAVYALVPQSIAPVVPDIYGVYLTGVYLDPVTCTVAVRYTSELSLSNASVWINAKPVGTVSLGVREIIFKPDSWALGEAFEHGTPLSVEVHATFNHIGRLRGEYSLPVGGLNPEISPYNGVLLVRNPNCFPLRLWVSIRYFDDEWRWSNTTYVVDGFSYIVVEPPTGVRFAYAYIYWFNQGEERWVGLPLKTW